MAEFTEKDWRLILPFLEENERLFRILVKNDLLSVGTRPQTHYVFIAR